MSSFLMQYNNLAGARLLFGEVWVGQLSLVYIEDTFSNFLQYLQHTLTYLTSREIFSYPHDATTNLNITTKGTN